jgi:hypothetical protein
MKMRAFGMGNATVPKMFRLVNTKDSSAVQLEVQDIYLEMFPNGSSSFVPEIFSWASQCFTGRYHDYGRIDARYHDFEHTLQVTLCFARLLQGYAAQAQAPILTRRAFELGLIAILFHDTGYLKSRADSDGTGAKYTLIHVARSMEFAARFLNEKGLSAGEVRAVQNMIGCTGVNADISKIPFQGELERIVGYSLSTADLLGQMAAEDYIDKLDILFSEFEESATYNQKQNLFSSGEDLKRKTPAFWDHYVLPHIENEFKGLYRYLGRPGPDGENWYLRQIDRNLDRLRGELASV